MALLVFLVLFLAMTGYSNAAYCLCKDGVSEQVLQKAIDYACGAGADCSQISQNGPCFQPNTVKDHCSFAVNSYYQKKSGSGATCDFSGAATLSPSPPAGGGSSSCSFSSSSSPGTGSGAPSTTPPGSTGGTPTGSPGTSTPGTSTPGTSTPGTSTPGTTTPGTSTPGTTTPSTTVPGMTPGSTTTPTTTNPGTSPSVFGGAGLGPTGSGYGIPDSSGSAEDLLRTTNLVFTLAAFALPWLLSMLGW